ncbi:MAG: formate dehydrogenase accessory sulfurtransferase FdhD, partial [Thermoproteus sp.]
MWRDVNGIKVAVDQLFQIYVNGNLEATLVASPSDLDELALGFLYAEGYIEGLDDVLELEVSGRRIRARIRGDAKSTGRLLEECGGIEGERRWALVEAKVDMEKLRSLVSEFGKFTMPSVEPSLAMHTSALLNGEWIIAHDVSRHSSMLKLVGKALKAGRRGGIAFTTGRASSDLVERAAAAG